VVDEKMTVSFFLRDNHAMDDFLRQFVDSTILERVSSFVHAVVFVNYPNQCHCTVTKHNMTVYGVRDNKNRFYARHFIYNIPQGVAWREPPILTQLTILQGFGMKVNTHKHFVSPSLTDLASFMWDYSADSLDVFAGHPTALDTGFRFQFNTPLVVTTAIVDNVTWIADQSSCDEDKSLVLPIRFTNTVKVRAMGSLYSLRNLPHTLINDYAINKGTRLKVVVCMDDSPCITTSVALLDVVRPSKKPSLPLRFRWINGECCLIAGMQCATEMQYCCRRLGLPKDVPLQTFYAAYCKGVNSLHKLLHSKPVGDMNDAHNARLWSWCVENRSLSVEEIMHCSGVFAPSGLLKIYMVARTDTYMQKNMSKFEQFLTRQEMWTAAHHFNVVPMKEKRKKPNKLKSNNRKTKVWKGKGIPIGQSIGGICLQSCKPTPSPPNDLVNAF